MNRITQLFIAGIYRTKSHLKNAYILVCAFGVIFSCASQTSIRSKPQNCWEFIGSAIKYREAHLFSNAIADIKRFDTCETVGTSNMVYYYHLGWTYHEMGEFKKAIALYTMGLSAQPTYPYVYWRRGLAYAKIMDTTKANEDFRTTYKYAIEFDPKKFQEQMDMEPLLKETMLRIKESVDSTPSANK